MKHPSKTHAASGSSMIALVMLTWSVCSTAFAAEDNPEDRDPTAAPAVLDFDLDAIPPLPDGIELSGAIAGIDRQYVIITGGVKNRETSPLDPAGVLNTELFVLDLARLEPGWQTPESVLPEPIAHGVSISHPKLGVVSIGGDDGDGFRSDVFCVRMHESGATPERIVLPPLPEPMAHGSGAIVAGDIFVFGGRSTPDGPARSTGWRLPIDAEGNPGAWSPIRDLPGPGRMLAVAAEWRGDLYCFSGIALGPVKDEGTRPEPSYLRDAWRYAPHDDSWTAIADLPRPAAAAASPAIGVGWDMLAVVGGDHGSASDEGADGILVYHPITDRWTRRGSLPTSSGSSKPFSPAAIAVRDTGTQFDGSTVIMSGRTRTTASASGPWIVRAIVVHAGLGWIDWTAVGLYAVVLIWMGVHFSRREKSTDDYFLAGRRIPWWASGISIFATSLSAITFMTIPAKAWDTDWTYLLQNLLIIVVAPIAAILLVPAFRRLDVTTAYEYLEHRFHWSLRLAASALYMLFQVGRVALVTLLPSLALATVTDLDVTTCIVVMGILCILYTVLGGIEAVIWSDVLQAAILFGGAAWAMAIMLSSTDGGVSGLIAEASTAGKMRVVDFSFDLTRASLLVIVLGGIFSNLVPYASDQSVVQRYLAVKDVREAKRAVWAGAFLALPASLLFFGLGTALWGFYRSNPEVLRPTGQLDQILPLFIVDMLPTGVAGIVLAGLFAAAMSSLDSSMNSVATAFTTDWYRRFRPDADERRRLRIAKIATVSMGVVGTSAAVIMAGLDEPSLFDLWFKVLGLFGSGIAGVFLLGALTTRTGPIAGWCGLVTSAVAVWSVGMYTDVSGLAYAAVGIMTCLIVGFGVGMWDRRTAPE